MITEIIRFDRELMARLKAEREAIEEAKEELETSKSTRKPRRQPRGTDRRSEGQVREQNIHIKELRRPRKNVPKSMSHAQGDGARQPGSQEMAAELAKQSKYVGGEYSGRRPDIIPLLHYGNRYHPITKNTVSTPAST